jgi:hypothetical protein
MDSIKSRHNARPEMIYRDNKEHLEFMSVNAATCTVLPPNESRKLREPQVNEKFTEWLGECELQLDRKVRLDEPQRAPGAAGQDAWATVQLWGRPFVKYG